MPPRKKKAQSKNEYEVLSRIDFGYLRDDKRRPKPEEEQPENFGVVEPTPPEEENPKVSLTEEEAAPLLAAQAIKPAGAEDYHVTKNPEEHGYEGETLRDEAMKNDEVYTGAVSSSSSSSSSESSS